MEIKAIILDLDQTLTTDTASWLQFTKLLGADFTVHTDIYNRFRAGEISYKLAKSELISLWKSTSELDRTSIENIFKKVELRDGAIEAVQYLKQKYKICIISGAIDVFVEIISEKLGVKDRYASTKFTFDDNDTLIDFQYTLSRGEEKVKFFKDFCLKNNLSPKECVAIGDGDSDVPIFQEVGFPILFVAQETSPELIETTEKKINNWNEIQRYL
jgi:phosphoserine phosphatase